MSHDRPAIPEELTFYISAPHECSYLEDRDSVTLFADPEASLERETFSALSEMGFRRSGCFVYTPRCPGCQACIPVRIVVDEFKPNRSQRRCIQANRDLDIRVIESQFSDEHIDLYRRYIQDRHPDGSMNVSERKEVEQFFLCEWSDTFFLEFRLEGKVIALAVVDKLRNGLSAVYTFFDPAYNKRSLGVYAVLALVDETRRRQLPYLYLGYLIYESAKMAYKANYRPMEQLRHGQWLPLNNH